MFVVLPIIFLLKNIDTTDPEILFYFRVLFIASHSAILCTFAAVYFLANKKKDETPVTVKPAPAPTGWGAPPEPAEPEPDRILPTHEYDVEELRKLAGSMVMSVAITCFIHYKWEIVPPLVIQSVMNSLKVAQHSLFSIYVLGKPAEGSLARPWVPEPAPSLFGGMAAEAEEPADDVDGDDGEGSETKAIEGADEAETAEVPKGSKKSEKARKRKKPKVHDG